MAFTLYHGKHMKADSQSLDWVKNVAMVFHQSEYYSKNCGDVFILPRNT